MFHFVGSSITNFSIVSITALNMIIKDFFNTLLRSLFPFVIKLVLWLLITTNSKVTRASQNILWPEKTENSSFFRTICQTFCDYVTLLSKIKTRARKLLPGLPGTRALNHIIVNWLESWIKSVIFPRNVPFRWELSRQLFNSIGENRNQRDWLLSFQS